MLQMAFVGRRLVSGRRAAGFATWKNAVSDLGMEEAARIASSCRWADSLARCPYRRGSLEVLWLGYSWHCVTQLRNKNLLYIIVMFARVMKISSTNCFSKRSKVGSQYWNLRLTQNGDKHHAGTDQSCHDFPVSSWGVLKQLVEKYSISALEKTAREDDDDDDDEKQCWSSLFL